MFQFKIEFFYFSNFYITKITDVNAFEKLIKQIIINNFKNLKIISISFMRLDTNEMYCF